MPSHVLQVACLQCSAESAPASQYLVPWQESLVCGPSQEHENLLLWKELQHIYTGITNYISQVLQCGCCNQNVELGHRPNKA